MWFLSPQVSNEQLKQASELAETYEDFGVLIDLCDTMKDRNKLREYMNRFSEQVRKSVQMDQNVFIMLSFLLFF